MGSYSSTPNRLDRGPVHPDATPRGHVHPPPPGTIHPNPPTTLTVHQGKEAAGFDRLQLAAVENESFGFS